MFVPLHESEFEANRWVEPWMPGGARFSEGEVGSLNKAINKMMEGWGMTNEIAFVALGPEERTGLFAGQRFWSMWTCLKDNPHKMGSPVTFRDGTKRGEPMSFNGPRFFDFVAGLKPVPLAEKLKLVQEMEETNAKLLSARSENISALGIEEMSVARTADPDNPALREFNKEAGGSVSASVPASIEPPKKGKKG